MSKPRASARLQSRAINSKITHYFPSSSQASSSSSPVATLPKSSFTTRPKTTQSSTRLRADVNALANNVVAPTDIISVDSGSNSHISVSSDTLDIRSITYISSGSSEIPPPTTSPLLQVVPRIGKRCRKPGANRNVKRADIPEVHSIPSTRSSSIMKSSIKRKRILNSDTDVELLDTVIYIPKNSDPKPLACKENILTVRNSSTNPSPKRRKPSHDLTLHYVASSQSDEQELSVLKPPQDLAVVKESVQKWRAATVDAQNTTQSHQLQSGQDACQPVHDGLDHASVAPVKVSSLNLSSPNSEYHALVSTPPSPTLSVTTSAAFRDMDEDRLTSLPSSDPPISPVAASADEVIAQLKAEAMAAALREEESSSNVPIHFSDSSSDEDDDVFGLHRTRLGESSSSSLQNEGKSLQTAGSRRSRRLIDRSHSPSNSTSLGLVVDDENHHTRPRSEPNRRPVILTTGLATKQSMHSNPLTQMLREKQRAEKSGCGMKARLAAEELVMASELSDDLDSDIEGFTSTDLLPNNASGSSKDVMDLDGDLHSSTYAFLNGARVEKLLGVKEGHAVGKILNHDRKNQTRTTSVVGIDFFSSVIIYAGRRSLSRNASDAEMAAGDTTDVIFDKMKKAVIANDTARVRIILDGGLFGRLLPVNKTLCVRWLFHQVFAPDETSYEDVAYYALSAIPSDNCMLSFQLHLPLLLQMRADRSLLMAIGLEFPDNIRGHKISKERRTTLVHRWASITAHFARNGALEQALDVVILLLLVALDKSASHDLKRVVMIAIDNIGQSVFRGEQQMERVICVKVFKLASQLSPANQCCLLSLLGGCCLSTRRILRWISLAILVGENALPKDHLNHPLPLWRVSQLLTAPFESGKIFDIQDKENTDYEDLTYHVTILSSALADIDDVATEDHGCKDANEATSKATLETIITQLDALHGKILDTRAAHLDRSRAKAALQNLSFRIRYQCIGAQNYAAPRRQIENYFKREH